jgi:hypothetical protein
MNQEAHMIRSRHLDPTLVAVGALILSLMIAWGTDWLLAVMVQRAQSTFQVFPAYLFRIAVPLLQAAVMLALAWTLLIKLPPIRVAAIIYIAAGCLIVGTYLTIFTGFPVGMRDTIIGRFRLAIMDLGPHSSLYHLAAFWIILGLASLLRRPKMTEATPGQEQGKSTD